jgi:hypothetical protein
MKLTKEKINLLTNGTREERIYAIARSFKLFAVFYFTKYFTYQPAPFHDDFFQDFEDLVYGRIKDATWMAYRESTKTSIAKMGLCWLIARKQVIDALQKQGEEVSQWGTRLCKASESGRDIAATPLHADRSGRGGNTHGGKQAYDIRDLFVDQSIDLAA